MERMADEYLAGAEVVYGVRSKRDTDTFFKVIQIHFLKGLQQKVFINFLIRWE